MSTNDLEKIEFAENPDPRCPCVLLLDVSSSMQGQSIDALNMGLRAFQQDVAKDSLASRRVEVAIVTFGTGARVVQDFITVDTFTAPQLQAGGQTHMGAGIDTALTILDQRKATYKNNGVMYYRPWVFLITDGSPYGETDAVVDSARQRVLAEQRSNKVAFFAVGTESANFTELTTFTVPERPPMQLSGVQFVELFVWLSRSQQAVAQSRPGDQVPLPPAGWASV
jgi:uncharacterized protein YegL